MRIIYLWPKIVELSANIIVICILCEYFVCLLDHKDNTLSCNIKFY